MAWLHLRIVKERQAEVQTDLQGEKPVTIFFRSLVKPLVGKSVYIRN